MKRATNTNEAVPKHAPLAASETELHIGDFPLATARVMPVFSAIIKRQCRPFG
jgi:hypothetical protein